MNGKLFSFLSGLLLMLNACNSPERTALYLKSCYIMEYNEEHDSIMEETLHYFAQDINADFISGGPFLEVINNSREYHVFYTVHIPKYGRMIETYWDESNQFSSLYREWDQDLLNRLSVVSDVESCPDGWDSAISG
ncbi:hypothetical protein [Marinicauda salina]|uniref:hypothetical protein n=1 Tax=Marinicauda salina TaxID=2135793 RepID=UPI0011B26C8D|nr:hypothetical protein [Marinicauda salina]